MLNHKQRLNSLSLCLFGVLLAFALCPPPVLCQSKTKTPPHALPVHNFPQLGDETFPNTLPHYPGLEMTANLDKVTYSVGEPVVLTLKIRNATPQTIILGWSALERSSFSFVVRGRNKELPLTFYGIRLLTPPMAVAANALIELPAGQTRPYSFDLSQMYSLTTPGSYTISVRRLIYKSNRLPYPQDNQQQIVAEPIRFALK